MAQKVGSKGGGRKVGKPTLLVQLSPKSKLKDGLKSCLTREVSTGVWSSIVARIGEEGLSKIEKRSSISRYGLTWDCGRVGDGSADSGIDGVSTSSLSFSSFSASMFWVETATSFFFILRSLVAFFWLSSDIFRSWRVIFSLSFAIVCSWRVIFWISPSICLTCRAFFSRCFLWAIRFFSRSRPFLCCRVCSVSAVSCPAFGTAGDMFIACHLVIAWARTP